MPDGRPMGRRIRAHDWSRSPLGPLGAWPDALRVAAGLVVDSCLPMTVLWGRDLVQAAYNDAYADLAGEAYPMLLGRATAGLWHRVAFGASAFEAAWRGEAGTVEARGHEVPSRAERVSVLLQVAPLRDPEGRVAGVLVTLVEQTRQARAEWERGVLGKALAAERAQLDALIAHMPSGVIVAEAPSGRILTGNRQAEAIWGHPILPSANLADYADWKGFHPDDGRPYAADEWPLARSIATGEVVEDEVVEIERADGERRCVAVFSAPVRRPGGEVEAGVVLFQDVTERRRMDEALRESEARLRMAIEAGRLGLWELDAETGALVASEACRRDFGRDPASPFGRDDLLASIHPEDRERHRGAMEAMAAGGDLDLECRVVAPDGIRWIHVRGQAVGGGGRPRRFVGVSLDVTGRKRAEERQRLLLAELNHRVKNTLATVQSIAQQTLRHAASAEDFAEAFLARLRALANTHGLLTAREWLGADLRAVLAAELEPYGDEAGRVALAGPAVHLGPPVVLALGMVTHELATNAAKHGALSVPGGRVAVSWEVVRDVVRDGRGEPVLEIEWLERGGPPVTPPRRRGFGSVVLQRGLSHAFGGRLDLAYEPEGVRCRIAVGLSDGAPAPADDDCGL
jgi:PAS domain S-box-containing protein